MKWILMAACALGAVAVAGCGSSANSLFGSISAEYSLDFDSTQINTTTPFLVISYIRSSGPVGKPAKLSVDLSGVNVTAGSPIDLTMLVGNAPRGTLQRIESTTINFPIKTGTIVLDEAPKANANLSGHFNATLSMPDGRTLDGTFSGTVVPLQ